MPEPALTGPLYLRNNLVLVVDDEPLNLQVFDYNFGRDFSLSFANNAEEALAILREERVAVIVADHRMPGMQGLDLLSWVAEHRPQTVRLLLTAHTDITLLLDAVNRGILFRYLPKPWDADGMRQDIMLAIQRHLLEDENARLRAAAEKNPHEPAAVAAALALDVELVLNALRQDDHDGARALAEGLLDGAQRSSAPLREPGGAHDPNEVALAAVAGVRSQITRLGVELETELSPGLPQIGGSRSAIISALAALIQNAVEAMDGQSDRRVLGVHTTQSPDGGVRYTVTDDGVGFPPSAAQAGPRSWFSTRGKPGMGLAIANAVARSRGGSLTIAARPAGGSAIHLDLPPWSQA
jgi:CheY-like chemotaxis protein